jgi:uncharacterized Zn finger protein (UPF0148 family)
MDVRAVSCTKCGAPLPPTAIANDVVTCPFCDATLALEHASAPDDIEAFRKKVHDVEALEAAEQSKERQKRLAVINALKAAALAKRDLYDVLRESLATLLERSDADDVARATFAIASDFERETKVALRGDALALDRIYEALIIATKELPTGTYDMNLPFIGAGPGGPVHLQRTLTLAVYAELCGRSPVVTPPPAPPIVMPVAPAASVAAPAFEDPPKKKKWFLF